MDTAALRKARGAFFTPPEIASFIAQWAVRSRADRVLEPSCGEAAFLVPAASRLALLGANLTEDTLLHGVELHTASAISASRIMGELGASALVKAGDFFNEEPCELFDAVVGNPPYIRFQEFSGEARARSLRAALAEGVRLSGLASSWASFTIHASKFLKPTGRLGLVLPAELLTVGYAGAVRKFLLQRFARVRLVLFEERVFPGVLEDVVLLLAEGHGGATHFEVYQAKDRAELWQLSVAGWTGHTPNGGDKWTPALLPPSAISIYQDITAEGRFISLLGWGDTYLGAVTGNNDYFTLTRADVLEWGLSQRDVKAISPPGSRHLRAFRFAETAWENLAKEGKRCLLFYPQDPLSDAARRYIAYGEALDVPNGYKCRNRKPWWRVPLVAKPDLLLTYMNHERPRLISNDAGVQLLNSLYGIALKPDAAELGREMLPLASLNSATLLGAEVVGRAYGGGLLKHEPKEADLLPVPSPELLEAAADDLRNLRPQIAAALRSPDPWKATNMVDEIILETHLGLDKSSIGEIRDARAVLFRRRLTRSRSDRAGN